MGGVATLVANQVKAHAVKVNNLCFDGRKYDPFLINIVKCFAA